MKRTVNRTLLKRLMKMHGIEPTKESHASTSTVKKLAYNDYESELKPVTMEQVCDRYDADMNELFPVLGGDGEEDDGPEAA